MAGMDAAEPKERKKGSGLRRQKRRVSIRIDMTPMVDIAFLLLIFFMVTTVFRKPQAMEVNLPPAGVSVQVPESNVITLFVRADERIYFRKATGPLESTAMKDLVQFFTDEHRLNPELIVLVKVHREARYETMVDVMDELELADMSRFSLVPMQPEDVKEVEALP
jgi:biopolymer transport protein ExbD